MFRSDAKTQNLSLRLSRILDDTGVNERIVTIWRQERLRAEKFANFIVPLKCLQLPLSSIYFFGSQIECSTTKGLNSDFDGLSCTNGVKVIQDAKEQSAIPTYLILQGGEIPAGYCRLQCLTGTTETSAEYSVFNSHTLDNKGRLILRNTFFDSNESGGLCTVHGPAVTSTSRSGTYFTDYVYALKCDSVSQQVLLWVQRSRYKYWPTADMLKTAKQSGFFLVPVGHRLSKSPDLEWRVSPSLTERSLMFSMNMTQLRCYVVLKMIKKDLITPVVGECITSFHLKTILFYSVENTEEEFWREENLWNCISLGLERLLTCVKDRSCQNFLIPEENLFLGRIDEKQYLSITTLLENIIRSGPECLFKIQSDLIGQKLQEAHISSSMNKHHNPGSKTMTAYLYMQLLRCPSLHFMTFLSDINLDLDKEISSCTAEVHKYIFNLRECHRHLQDEDIKAYATTTLMFLYSTYGSLLASACIKDGVSISQRAISFLKRGFNSDFMSGRLKYASVLYSCGQFEEASRLLEDIQNQYDSEYVQAVCDCSDRPYQLKPAFCDRVSSCSTDKQKRMLMACHIVFTRHEICCPPPLIFEMFCFVKDERYRVVQFSDYMDHAVVDSVIFIHLLLFLTYKKLGLSRKEKRAFLNLLLCFDREQPYLNHCETAVNIIGQCCEMQGDRDGAFSCYISSLRGNKRYNAARWLLALLVYKQIRSQKS